MAVYRVKGPDGAIHKFEGPDDATQEQVLAAAQAQFGGANAPASDTAQPAQNPAGGGFRGSMMGGLLQGLRDPVDAGAQLLYHALPDSVTQAGDKLNNYLADNTVAGSLGLIDKIPERNLSSLVAGNKTGLDAMIQKNEAEYQKSRAGNDRGGFDAMRTIGNVLTTLPIGAGSMPASIGGQIAKGTVQGAAVGAMQPVLQGDFAEEKAKQVGWGAGMGGALAPLGAWVSNKINSKEAQGVADKAKNALRDDTLAQGRAAGYVVPNSEISPSFLGNRLESIGGKAAIKQQAAHQNQEVTNALTRKALGVSDDVPISKTLLEQLRGTAGKAYADVASLSKRAKSDLEALKQARSDAQGWFNAYNRSASPDDLLKAKTARAVAEKLEQSLEKAAEKAKRSDLIPALREARKTIAKSYTVERALNPATGDISAPTIARMYGKGKPLSDGLETVGQFATAFPKFTGEGVKTPAAGISKTEALMSALLGAGGAAATGNPIGLAAAALPLASGPARSLALSKALQATPNYSVGNAAKLAEELAPYFSVLGAYGAQ